MVSVYSIWQIHLVLKVEGQDGLTFYICDLYRSRHRQPAKFQLRRILEQYWKSHIFMDRHYELSRVLPHKFIC